MRRLPAWIVVAFLLWTWTAASQSGALFERLNPSGHVNDFAGVMGNEAAPVEALLTELEQKTGAEVAVVALTSLEGEELADFSNRLFERWGIGEAGEDNGALLLAAIEDRQVRIEVGYGLEPLITDARAGRILDESVLPYFRQDQYGPGLASGAAAIAGVIAENAGVELTGQITVPPAAAPESSGWRLLLRIAIILAVLIVFGRNPWLALMLLSSGGGRRGGFGGGGFGRGGGGFGGFGGGMSGGGGAGRSW